MAEYIVKRVAMAFVTVLVVASITFFLMNMVPGGPFLSEKSPSPEVLALMEEKYGLDKPISVQLGNYLKDLFRGDLGVSFKMQKNRPVSTIIKEMFPVSAKLGVISLLWATAVGLLVGIVSAYKRGTWVDSLLRVVNTLGVALPTFVTATVLMVLFAGGVFSIFDAVGLQKPSSYILPCFTLGLSPMCHIARYTRSSMLDALGQDYIRTAVSKGLPTRRVLIKHALRNALIPVVTYLGPMVAGMLTGSLVVETVFNIPGLGRYFVQSISNRDYPLIMGTTIFLASFVVIMNLVVDILYKVIDPRIELNAEGVD